MNWLELQAQVGVLSAHGQVAMLAAIRRDVVALNDELERVRLALYKIDELKRESPEPTGA